MIGQRASRRLRSVHREQRRPRRQCRPEESALAGSGLPQVARSAAHPTARLRQRTAGRSAREGLMQRTLESRAFIAAILAMVVGTFLFYTHPFPDEQIFTSPYLVCSTVLSGLYIFTLKARQTISPGRLPKYPDPSKRDDLFLVVGEVHNPRKPVPAKAPYWLTIPERGLFTGIAILGAIGSGKTSCCMLPFAEQILAYKAVDKEKRIGGLILDVKGDFCRKVKDVLERHQRAEDYIEISLDSEYCYNPLHNDLDAYALAYNIASLLNNLFGRGKEPFWQQAYTNLVKFIILLHKVAYD